MWGGDIEHDPKEWELTTELCKLNKKPKLTKELISMAFEEASKLFDMSKFPSTDNGNFEQLSLSLRLLRRVQDVSQAIQRRLQPPESRGFGESNPIPIGKVNNGDSEHRKRRPTNGDQHEDACTSV